MQISSEEIPEDSPNYLKTSTRLSRSLAFPRSSAAETRNIRTDLCAQNASENRGTLTFFFFLFFCPPSPLQYESKGVEGGLPSTACGYYLFIQLFFSLNNPFFFFPFFKNIFFYVFFCIFFSIFFYIYIF